MTEKTFSLNFGGLSTPIYKQIKEQGIKVTKAELEKYQKISDSILMLKIHGFLSDAIARKAQQKLFNQIVKMLEEK